MLTFATDPPLGGATLFVALLACFYFHKYTYKNYTPKFEKNGQARAKWLKVKHRVLSKSVGILPLARSVTSILLIKLRMTFKKNQSKIPQKAIKIHIRN